MQTNLYIKQLIRCPIRVIFRLLFSNLYNDGHVLRLKYSAYKLSLHSIHAYLDPIYLRLFRLLLRHPGHLKKTEIVMI